MKQFLKFAVAIVLATSSALTSTASFAVTAPAQGMSLAGTWKATFHCNPSCVPGPHVPTATATVTLDLYSKNVYTGTLTVLKPYVDTRVIYVFQDPQDGIVIHSIYSALHLLPNNAGRRLTGSGMCTYSSRTLLISTLRTTWTRVTGHAIYRELIHTGSISPRSSQAPPDPIPGCP